MSNLNPHNVLLAWDAGRNGDMEASGPRENFILNACWHVWMEMMILLCIGACVCGTRPLN